MKKLIKIITMVFMLLIIIPPQEVAALSTSVSINGPTTLVPGQTGTYTITFNSSETAYFKYSITGSNLTLSGRTQHEAFGEGDKKRESVTITATAKTAGVSTSISVSGVTAPTGISAGLEKNISNSLEITVKKPAPAKSGNNFLKSLTVSQGSLAFNKNTTGYTVLVDHSVSSITVGAAAEDGRASVTGTGTRSLNVYANNVSVGVKAENGAMRYYTINVVRKDEDGNAGALSNNNNLSTLSIDGDKLDFSKDKLDYEYEVDNLVESVEVKATPEDSKATVKVLNVDKLAVGPNEIKVVVASESEKEKTYTINVIRSNDAPTVKMEDLEEAMKKLTADEIIVIADEKGIIKKSVLEQIETSKKIMYVNQVDEDGKILYQWKFDGSKIDNIQDVNINLSFESKNGLNIDKLSNYAKGLILSFENNPTLPSNTEVGIFVGDDYEDESLLNLYFYDSETDELSLEQSDLQIVEGFVWLKLDHTSEYFLTPATIQGVAANFNPWMIGTIVASAVSLIILIYVVILRKKITTLKKSNKISPIELT